MVAWSLVWASVVAATAATGEPSHQPDTPPNTPPDPMYIYALPETHDKWEQGLVHSIRKDPHNARAFCQLSQFLIHRVHLGTKHFTHLIQAAQLGNQCHHLGSGSLAQWGWALEQEALWLMGGPRSTTTPLPKDPAPPVLAWEAKKLLRENPQEAKALAGSALDAWKSGLGVDTGEATRTLAAAIELTTQGATRAQELSKAAQKFQSGLLWNRAAVAYEKIDAYEASAASYLKAIDLGNPLEPHLNLGLLEATRLGQVATGLGRLQAAQSWVEKEGGSPLTRALVLSYKSLVRMTQETTTSSKDALKEDVVSCLELGAGHVEFSSVFLQAVHKAGHLELVEGTLEKVSLKYPAVAVYQTYLGHIAKKRGQREKAHQHYTAARTLDPGLATEDLEERA